MTWKVSTATGTAISCNASSLATAGLFVDEQTSWRAKRTVMHYFLLIESLASSSKSKPRQYSLV